MNASVIGTLPGSKTAAGLTFITAGTMVANIAGYLLHWPALRWLGLDGYSEFATLLAAQLVLVVPALALQNVIARERVRGVDTARLHALSIRCAALVAALAVLLVPVLAIGLKVSVLASFAALLAAPAIVVLSGEQGIMQGEGRFRELGVVLAVAGLARVAPAVAVLATGAGTAPALIAAAVGAAVVAVGARLRNVRSAAGGANAAVRLSSVFAASQLQLAMIALASIDLLLTRVVLVETDASLYSLGAVVTKVAFWLPQAISIVLYPQLASASGSGRALRSALLMLTGLGVVVVAGIAVCSPIVPVVIDQDYTPVVGLLWLFALQGALLAVAQGALISAVAADRTRAALIAWCGLIIEVVLILTAVDGDLERLLSIAVACSAGVAAVTVAFAVRLHSGRG